MVYSSELIPIIRRLDAMREDKTGIIQKRHFGINGNERCVVIFDGFSGKFKLIDRQSKNENEYEFDDIDYLAVEIFELLQPRKFNQQTNEKEKLC